MDRKIGVFEIRKVVRQRESYGKERERERERERIYIYEDM